MIHHATDIEQQDLEAASIHKDMYDLNGWHGMEPIPPYVETANIRLLTGHENFSINININRTKELRNRKTFQPTLAVYISMKIQL